jgi:tetratricopeptide (TPR) repeat protein
MLLIAFMLSQGSTRRLAGWRAANWWLYPPLIVAGILFITFKNVNVVKADTLLKEGQKYRDARLWDLAIAVHEAARDADPDEDFYYLMLALNYQLKAQDGRQDAQTRELAWREGERIALEARDINKYNPDNTGNMGRYYFTIAQLFDQSYYDQALDFFKKAAQLAPQNVDYYNLVGQAYYAKGNYDEALSWYQTSTEIDERYFPTQLYKGDTHVAQQEIEEAIEAHKNAIRLNAPGFIDDNFDQRLNFYLSINRADELVEAFQDYIDTRPETPYDAARAKTLWGIGHTYLRSGQSELANNYFQQALDAGYNDANAFVEIGDSFLAQEEFARAESAYQEALAKNQNLPQVHSSLGFIYARTGRIPEAIEANKRVLESLPNDYDSNKNLALLYQQVGDLQPALTHAQIALDAAPDNAKADLQAFIAQIQQLLE